VKIKNWHYVFLGNFLSMDERHERGERARKRQMRSNASALNVVETKEMKTSSK